MDINALIYETLKKTGFSVVYQYPQKSGTLPVISFYTISESPSFGADNLAVFCDASAAVDIFAAAPHICAEIAEAVQTAMSGDGWRKDFAADVPDDTDGVFHKTMRFTNSFYN